MQSVASRYLRGLHGQPLREAVQLLLQNGTMHQGLLEGIRVHSIRCTIGLRDNLSRAAMESHIILS